MQRCLRPGGRLVLRDVTSDNKLLLWFMDKIELPLANLCGHGDVKIATRGLIADCCKQVVKCFDEKHGVKCAEIETKSKNQQNRKKLKKVLDFYHAWIV